MTAKPMTPEEFKTARKSLGHTQATLADEWGKTERCVRRWENGERPIDPLAQWAIRRLLNENTATSP